MQEKEDGSYILDLSEWLEFKVDIEVGLPTKHWWQLSKYENVEKFVSIKRDSIVAVVEQKTDQTKTAIVLNNGKCITVNMPYAKVMELV